MRYVKAQDIFPEELVEQIQDYVDGEYIYIPRKDENRKAWGEKTSSRQETAMRNRAIYEDAQQGMSRGELAAKYFLSEKSIQRILSQQKKER